MHIVLVAMFFHKVNRYSTSHAAAKTCITLMLIDPLSQLSVFTSVVGSTIELMHCEENCVFR